MEIHIQVKTTNIYSYQHILIIYDTLGCPVDVDDKSKRWCSTKVDSHGNHIAHQNQYGHCANNCPAYNNHNNHNNHNNQNSHSNQNNQGKFWVKIKKYML